MKVEVANAIVELKKQFGDNSLIVRDDDQGGAYIVVEPIELGSRYRPSTTWFGFHIPAQYPYADIYPVFIGANIVRADGIPFQSPVTPGHSFEGRPAIQVSRKSPSAQNGSQKAVSKLLKVIDFLENLS